MDIGVLLALADEMPVYRRFASPGVEVAQSLSHHLRALCELMRWYKYETTDKSIIDIKTHNVGIKSKDYSAL